MKNFYILLVHELQKLLQQASTYFIAAFFFLLMGFNFIYTLFLHTQTLLPTSCLQNLFELFWLPTLFILPLITMRILSEEQSSGLLERLFSTPVGVCSFILSKFCLVYFFYVGLWLLCLVYPFVAQYLIKDNLSVPFISPTILYGGLLFILASNFLFIAIGIFASSLTRTQMVAGFLGFSFLFILLVGPKALGEMSFLPYNYSIYIDSFETLDNLCRGLFDLRPFIFYLGGGGLFLLLTITILSHKTLK